MTTKLPVDAVASGTGAKASVTLTKRKTHYDAAVKMCADNQTELNTLRRMLRVRDASGVSSSAAPGGEQRQSVEKKPRMQPIEVIDLC